MRAWAVVVTVVLSVVVGACGGQTSVGVSCEDGKRLADVAIHVRFDLPVDQQDDFVAREFNPGFDPVGGRTHYSSATAFVGSIDGPMILYLYMDAPLPAQQRARVRAQVLAHEEVDHVAFNVPPIGGFKPAGEC